MCGNIKLLMEAGAEVKELHDRVLPATLSTGNVTAATTSLTLRHLI